MNERSLSDYAGPEAQPKVVLLLPENKPFHNLWFNFGANKLTSLLGTRLNIIPGKNDKYSKDKEFMWEKWDSYM